MESLSVCVLFFHLNNSLLSFLGRVKWMDLGMKQRGWVSLGVYHLDQGEMKVILDDRGRNGTLYVLMP